MKYDKKNEKQSNRYWPVVVILMLMVLIISLMVGIMQQDPQNTGATPPGSSTSSNPAQDTQEEESIALEQGLEILRMDAYAGIYMEDGSNDVVSGVMMIILRNTTDQDLQLVRIDIGYADFTAHFEATNLPAGESAVLLEKNRHSAVTEEYQSIACRNIVFFSEPMDLQEDRINLTGTNGVIQVTNISKQDISGVIYIYYKNSSSDLYYGGITYRAKVEGGLAAGETRQILTGHYIPEDCKFLMVTCGE